MTNFSNYFDFINQAEPLLQSFWYIAIPSTIIFTLQSLITLFGLEFSSDTDFDNGLDSQLFSLRNLINFLLGISWTGISLYGGIKNPVLLIGISLFVGLLFVYLFLFIIKQVQKLAEDNSFKIQETLHQTAEVYLSIPAHKTGKGKVIISIRGSFHELDAITEFDKITTGSVVKIIGIESESLLLVQNIS